MKTIMLSLCLSAVACGTQSTSSTKGDFYPPGHGNPGRPHSCTIQTCGYNERVATISDDGEAAASNTITGATRSCSATVGCDVYNVTINDSKAKISSWNECSELVPVHPVVVGIFAGVTSASTGDEGVTYKSANGKFKLEDDGRFGMTLNAILTGGQTLRDTLCQ